MIIELMDAPIEVMIARRKDILDKLKNLQIDLKHNQQMIATKISEHKVGDWLVNSHGLRAEIIEINYVTDISTSIRVTKYSKFGVPYKRTCIAYGRDNWKPTNKPNEGDFEVDMRGVL